MFADFFLAQLGRESLIAADDTWALLALMVASVALAIWLEQKYVWASKISGAIIVLLIVFCIWMHKKCKKKIMAQLALDKAGEISA